MLYEVNIVLNWKRKPDEELNQYRLRIYRLDRFRTIAVASNITTFRNRTIADITPEIINFVRQYFNVLDHRIMLIEHYLLNNLKNADVYFHVVIMNNEVTRYDLSKDKLKRLIGKQI